MGRVGFIQDKLEIKFLILYVAARLIEPVPFEAMQELTSIISYRRRSPMNVNEQKFGGYGHFLRNPAGGMIAVIKHFIEVPTVNRTPVSAGNLGPNGELSDIQQAFIDEAAIQCGFCTPGFIMTAVEILETNRLYTDDELRKLLSGHLCRCTGYENILRAVKKTMYRRLGLPLPE